MKNVIEILERYYQSFIGQRKDWHFFLGLADYIKYAIETPETDKILRQIVQARNNEEKRLKKYAKEVIKETKKAKNKLFEIIKKNKISYEELSKLIEEYEGYESGRIQGSRPDAEALSDALSDIIRSLFKNGHKKLVKDFAIEHKEIPNEVGKYTFSKTLDLYEKEREIFSEKLKTELWASWNDLVLIYLAIFKGKEELERLSKNKKKFFNAWNFAGLVGEMEKIRDSSIDRLTGIVSDFEPVHFIEENYISHATRIHNYLIQELGKKKGFDKKSKEPVFDEKNSILYFQNKKILISRSKNSNPHYVLKTMFQEKNKVWNYDEIWENVLGENMINQNGKNLQCGI